MIKKLIKYFINNEFHKLIMDKIDDHKNYDDILSEILYKIQDFKQRKENFNNIREVYNSNTMLDNLDKELIKGLEKLDNKRMIQDEKNIDISTTNKVEKKNIKRSKN